MDLEAYWGPFPKSTNVMTHKEGKRTFPEPFWYLILLPKRLKTNIRQAYLEYYSSPLSYLMSKIVFVAWQATRHASVHRMRAACIRGTLIGIRGLTEPVPPDGSPSFGIEHLQS